MRWTLVAAVLALTVAGCGAEQDGKPPAGAVVDEPAPPRAQASEPPKKLKKPKPEDDRQAERNGMVRSALIEWGVKDEDVIAAMRRCPRHRFVPAKLRHRAYWNRPLPIGLGQTISQPTVVGSMTEELRLPSDAKVLEIGTGSGYQAAVLAEIARRVYSIEIKQPLAERAAKVLKATGYDHVKVRHGDGYYGWPEEAPFDAIIVTAAAPHVPPPLVEQLKPGGRLVIPVGPPFARQDLVLVIKDTHGKVFTQSLYAVTFVPLTGSLGKRGD